MTTEQNHVWLTQEAYDKLHAELEELSGPSVRRSSPGSARLATRVT